MKYAFFSVGLLLGILLVFQKDSTLSAERYSDINEKNDFLFIQTQTTQEQNRLKEELASLKKEEEKLKANLSEDIQKTLEETERNAGNTEIRGAGVKILYEPLKNTSSEELAQELRSLLNVFFSLEAEGIALNGYRITFKTPLLALQNSILVQKFHISAPFTLEGIVSHQKKDSLSYIREKINNKERNLTLTTHPLIKIPARIY
jgi:uncharacterized protein YlxW (UPF0749 family)